MNTSYLTSTLALFLLVFPCQGRDPAGLTRLRKVFEEERVAINEKHKKEQDSLSKKQAAEKRTLAERYVSALERESTSAIGPVKEAYSTEIQRYSPDSLNSCVRGKLGPTIGWIHKTYNVPIQIVDGDRDVLHGIAYYTRTFEMEGKLSPQIEHVAEIHVQGDTGDALPNHCQLVYAAVWLKENGEIANVVKKRADRWYKLQLVHRGNPEDKLLAVGLLVNKVTTEGPKTFLIAKSKIGTPKLLDGLLEY
jgi:hypothetical protein